MRFAKLKCKAFGHRWRYVGYSRKVTRHPAKCDRCGKSGDYVSAGTSKGHCGVVRTATKTFPTYYPPLPG